MGLHAGQCARRAAVVLAVSVGMILAASTASGQAYPTKPIRLIVPFSAGGATDVIARLVAPELAKTLGQPVIVDNRPGASGAIGAAMVAKAPPDGYTVYFGGSAIVLLPLTDPSFPFDPLRDLAPVSQVHEVPLIITARHGLEATSLAQLIALAKTRPGKLTYATPGPGTSNHLSGEMLKTQAGIDMVPVHYKGESPAMPDLLSGRVDLAVTTILIVAPYLQDGRLKPVALTGPRRFPTIPDVPTVAESGFPGFEAGTFVGMNVATGTPQPVIETLYRAVAAAVKVPAVQAQMYAKGLVPVGSRPEAYAQFLHREREKWARLVKQTGVKRE